MTDEASGALDAAMKLPEVECARLATILADSIGDGSPQEEIDAMRPPIDGNQVMAYLAIPPSRTVGEIMDMLLERRIEDGPYTEDEAYAMLDRWREAHPDEGR